ncbi:protein NosL [Accumulibacter sp.]|uniref:protein NosL n=1 Tax=Accumulibacter sp. TaxID=2053492 RepID=UPI002634AB28|nr:protein NosL [Accumulibacter sp.]
MKRRRFLAALLGSGVGLSLTGCGGEPASGPVAIKWDRDTDARCGMVISDQRFAAQIRDPEHKIWKFDDIGCAVFWLAQRTFDEQTAGTEFWVADYRASGWLDARQAHYLPGKKSPMGYHFAALAVPEAGTLSYPEMKQRLLARGK